MTKHFEDDYTVHGISSFSTGQPPLLVFQDIHGNKIGVLDFKDGKLSFEGDADESAKMFVEHIIVRTGIPGSCPANFVKWLEREMPPGTVISDPKWWAPRIHKALIGTANDNG